MTKKKKEATMSISDLVVMQDDLKRKIDFTIPDEDLTDEMRVNKILYTTIDKTIEDSLWKEKKQEIDNARKQLEEMQKFKNMIEEISSLWKEIEKNFVYQNAYLVNHFDKSDENKYKLVVDHLTTELANAWNKLSNWEALEKANKILEFVDFYREKAVKELVKKRWIISALLKAFRQKLKEVNFNAFSQINETESKLMKSQFQEWLKLSEMLAEWREKATEAVIESLEIDELIPKMVIENNGDLTKSSSGTKLITLWKNRAALLDEANKIEEQVEQKRAALTEDLYWKPENYLDVEAEKTENKEINTINPLQEKAWFRLCKVIYIGLYGLAIIVGLWLWSEEAELWFWFVAITIIIFTLIKKAFYYIVLGKSFLQ